MQPHSHSVSSILRLRVKTWGRSAWAATECLVKTGRGNMSGGGLEQQQQQQLLQQERYQQQQLLLLQQVAVEQLQQSLLHNISHKSFLHNVCDKQLAR